MTWWFIEGLQKVIFLFILQFKRGGNFFFLLSKRLKFKIIIKEKVLNEVEIAVSSLIVWNTCILYIVHDFYNYCQSFAFELVERAHSFQTSTSNYFDSAMCSWTIPKLNNDKISIPFPFYFDYKLLYHQSQTEQWQNTFPFLFDYKLLYPQSRTHLCQYTSSCLSQRSARLTIINRWVFLLFLLMINSTVVFHYYGFLWFWLGDVGFLMSNFC